MGQYHYVKQGEYLAMIARAYGFASYKTIWDASENKELKNDRHNNPNILFPGDKLFIPDRETKEESRATDAKHRFEMEGEPLHLRIVLKDSKSKAAKGHDCTLAVEGVAQDITTKADGLLEREISEQTQQGKLVDRGKPADQPPAQMEIPLKIGHMDPVTEISGQIARLNNLGYLAGDPAKPPKDTVEMEESYSKFESAVEEFQCDFGLHVDGICGKETQAKLLEAHGC